jgi:hypothetical protein
VVGQRSARCRLGSHDLSQHDDVITGYKAARKHGFAHLKNWRVLGKVRTDPAWATALVRALLVLTNREVTR